MSGDPSDPLRLVSRETEARLRTYLTLLERWNARINLVAPASLAQAWQRHIADSAQLFPLIADPRARLVDLGSGGGCPGLVLAIMGCRDVHLVESDARKAVFLREAAREIGAAVTVHRARIEAAAPLGGAVVTARALAPLGQLLGLAHRHLARGGYCLLLKGARAEQELTAAAASWTMEVDRLPSRTSAQGCILRINALAPKPDHA